MDLLSITDLLFVVLVLSERGTRAPARDHDHVDESTNRGTHDASVLDSIARREHRFAEYEQEQE